jgi:molecular chaperone DnaJ
MSTRDYYEVLGLDRTADSEEIKGVYRKLAMKYHPDRNPGDESAAERFKEASEAYEVLGDPDKRSRYDRFGHAGVRGAFSGGGFDWSDFHHFDDFGDIFGSLFETLFGFGGARGGRRSNRGGDILHRLTITLEQAAKGVEVELSVDRHRACGGCDGTGSEGGAPRRRCLTCGGTGQMAVRRGIMIFQSTCESCAGRGEVVERPCGECGGKGLVVESVKVSVKIPPGIHSGQRIQLRGQGHASAHGGPRGDLFAEVTITPHKTFAREDDHVVMDLPISVSQAALGAQAEIPTLWGQAELKIPGGTQTHEVFRLQGQGMPILNRQRRGDMFVRTRVVTPRRLSERQQELFQQLAEEDGDILEPTSETLFEKGKDFLGKIFGG